MYVTRSVRHEFKFPDVNVSSDVTTQILVCRCHLMDIQLRVDAIMIKVIYIPDEESESKLGLRGAE